MSKLWSCDQNGHFHWPDKSKMCLVESIRKNMVVLGTSNRSDQIQRQKAWLDIYHQLISKGMPKMDIELVRKVWAKLRLKAIRRKLLQQGKKIKKGEKPLPLGDLYEAVINLLEEGCRLYPEFQNELKLKSVSRDEIPKFFVSLNCCLIL